MNRSNIVSVLKDINSKDLLEYTGNINDILQKPIQEATSKLDFSYCKFEKYLPLLSQYNEEASSVWEYLCINCFALHMLKETFKGSPPEDVLSVQDSLKLKEAITKFVNAGIRPNLLPNMPMFRDFNNAPSESSNCSIDSHTLKYNRLVLMVLNLIEIGDCDKMRGSIFIHLKVILAALHQLLHCPLKKPNPEKASSSTYLMTQDRYDKLIEDRAMFFEEYKKLRKMTHISYFTLETMKLFHDKIPNWLKKALSLEMDSIILENKGVQSISHALLYMHSDYNAYDRARTWKSLNIIIKIIFKFKGKPQFRSRIIPQVLDILKYASSQKSPSAYENIFVLCAKYAYDEDRELCDSIFVPVLKSCIQKFFREDSKYRNNEDITAELSQTIRLLYYSLILDDSNLKTPVLPIDKIKNEIGTLFYVYTCIYKFEDLNFKNELKDVLLKYFENQNFAPELLDELLYGIESKHSFKRFKEVALEVQGSNIVLKFQKLQIKSNSSTTCDAIFELLKTNINLLTKLFLYLLNCLSQSEKYFPSRSNQDLLDLEDNFTLHSSLETKLAVYSLLANISEDKKVQNEIVDKPGTFIPFFNSFLHSIIQKKVHVAKNFECADFQSLFTIVMVLDALTSGCNRDQLKEYQKILVDLQTISCETNNSELRSLVNKIAASIVNKSVGKEDIDGPKIKSAVDEAIELLSDPELPIRGHGLLCLSKLIEAKDVEALDKKQYIFNIFQQNLKNDDSYIYLTAIRGLASMADVFPDSVLNTLCEEYSEFKKNDSELRMKLGEVLVRVTKGLGEMTQKYRALLLNTFLVGTKDDDHLMRASSLSNLGEVCRVLGYKLGTILTEVLVCVHSIIATDKSAEARRAAVSVLRMLLAGLQAEMMNFLKEEILEIYRTLKWIHHNDNDDLMRLHAQLAIEELNANMEKILNTTPVLSFEKKPVVLN